MTPAQTEALRIAKYALERVIEGITGGDEIRLPDSLYKAIATALEEIDEAIPVGDLGEKPIRLKLTTSDPHYREGEARKILSDLETEALR